MGPRTEPTYQGKGKARLPIVPLTHRAAVAKANAYRTQSNRRNAIAGLTKKDTATVALFDEAYGTEAAKDKTYDVKAAHGEFLNRFPAEPSYQGKGKGKITAASVRENVRAAKDKLDLQFFGRRMSVTSMTNEEVDEVALHGMKYGKGSLKADTRTKLQKKFGSKTSYAPGQVVKGGKSVGTFMRRFNSATESLVKAPSVSQSSELMEHNSTGDNDAADLPLAMSGINLNKQGMSSTNAAADPETLTHSATYEGSSNGDVSPLSLGGYSDEDMEAGQILVPKGKHAKAQHATPAADIIITPALLRKHGVVRKWQKLSNELVQLLAELPDVDVEANLSRTARALCMSEAKLRAEIGAARSANDFVGLSVEEDDGDVDGGVMLEM